MKIQDSNLFSVVVPTFNGTRFLKRALDYFRHLSFRGRIILADNSSGEHKQFIGSCSREYSDLSIDVLSYPAEIRFLDKMVAALQQINSKFVMLHAHDDFMVPAAVEQCVEFLDTNPDYTVARGRVAMFSLARTGVSADQISVSLTPHPMRAYEQDDALERTLAHIEQYASTFYSVHSRESLIESFQITEAATKNVIFFQYLSSSLCALKGKVWCSEKLFYIRQGHSDSWSGRLKAGDYEHWPLLITSPEFSRYYQEFRATLCQILERSPGMSASVIGPRIDNAALGLFQRGYCAREHDNPEESRFLKRLNDQGSDEYRTLSSVVDFSLKYPRTF